MEALKTLEIDCESAALIPIWKNINLIKKIRQCGNKVVLISDMYHSADTIRAWLIRFDEFFADIPIYVSSEYSQKKWSGSLFRLISEKEHIKFSEWVHYGDNQYTDVDVPKKLGIHAIKYDYSQLKPYEKKAIEKYPGDYQLQRCIGISRALRLTYKSPKLQLGISLGGPVLYPYVRWILDQAIKDHIETLYFIARDGYVLKKIADILIQILGLPIKTKYFYCSRKSLRDPYFNKENQHITEIASYIKQEINFAEKFAFVEYMGTGTTQDCMYKVISEKGLGISGPTYYWYLSEDMMPKSGKMKMMFPLNRRFHTILELLVRAPHGQTIGYRRQGEVVYPVFEEQEGKALVEYDYEEYVKGVCLFSEEAAKIERDFDSRMNRLNQELFYVEYLADFSNMDLETADLLGNIPFQLDGIVKEIATYAPLVRDKALENLLKGDKHEYKGTNAALSIRRSIGDKVTRDSAVENSISFKVGRAITFIPRKVRGGVACFREHGWKYTFFRTLEHLHLK